MWETLKQLEDDVWWPKWSKCMFHLYSTYRMAICMQSTSNHHIYLNSNSLIYHHLYTVCDSMYTYVYSINVYSMYTVYVYYYMIYYDWICMHTCILPLRLPSCSKSMHEIQIQRFWPLWVQKPSIRPCLQNGAAITPACYSHWGFEKVLKSTMAVQGCSEYFSVIPGKLTWLKAVWDFSNISLMNSYQSLSDDAEVASQWGILGRRRFLSRRFRPTRPPPLCWEATVRWHCISQTASAH